MLELPEAVVMADQITLTFQAKSDVRDDAIQ